MTKFRALLAISGALFAVALPLLSSTAVAAPTAPTSPAPQPVVQAPACARPRPPTKGPVLLSRPLDEPTRVGLAASVYLALSDSSGANRWPERVIENASACPADTFALGEATFTIQAATDGRSPTRWATSPQSPKFAFLAIGPSAPDAYSWYRAGHSGQLVITHTVSYLVLVTERLRYVVGVYDQGLPEPDILKRDMLAALQGKNPLVATYDPDGEAVTVEGPTASGLQATLFAELPLHGQSATLRGPDGKFFAPDAGNGLTLRGSGFVCPQALGPYRLRDLRVLNGSDGKLDLSCRLIAPDGFITVYVTRAQTRSDMAAAFKSNVAAMEKSSPPGAGARDLLGLDSATAPYGTSWTDDKGVGQGTWLDRRGDYNLEVRATFNDRAATAAAVTAFYKERPAAP